MSERSARDLLLDIAEAAQRTVHYCQGQDYNKFSNDPKTQDAVIRNIEIIGEAAKNLPTDFKQAHSDIPWRDIAGMRDRLIHHYFGVNLDVVWQVITIDIPQLIEQIKDIAGEI